MDKQKQIEEIAKIMFEKAFENYETSGSVEIDTEVRRNFYSAFLVYCESLYNAGYRKIPENAVVLTREEYEIIDHNIKHLESVCNAHEKTIAYWEDQTKVARKDLFEVRKETAEKFAEMVSQAIVDNTYPYFDKDGKPVNIWKATTGFDKLDEIVKEFTGGKNGGNT